MNIYNFLHENKKKMPPCLIYKRLLLIACGKYGMTENEARGKCGLFDCGQWMEFLNMN